jgi:hypothetical protein
MPTYTLAPVPKQALLSDAGALIPNGYIYTYAVGTSTNAATYTTDAGTAHTNPIRLDANGRPPSEIYIPPGETQRWLFHDADDALVWTAPTVTGLPLSSSNQEVTGVAGEDLDAEEVVYLSDGSGSLTAGRWYLADADLIYASVTPVIGMVTADIASAATGTIRLAGQITVTGPLTAGSLYYVSATAGDLTATEPTLSRLVGQAESTTSLILTPNPFERWKLQVPTELTIASGAVVWTGNNHTIDTESDAATDDLATITATNARTGDLVVLAPENVARVVTVKDGTGNLLLNGDYALDATDATITLRYDGSNWVELCRSVNAGGGFPFLDKATLTGGELQTGTISLAASGCLVVFQNVEVDTDDVSLHLLINGATSGYEQVQRLSRIDGGYGYGGNPTDALYLDANIATHGRIGNAAGEQAQGHVYLSSDGTYLNWHGLTYEQNSNGDPTITQIAGFLNLGGAITSITMASSSGNIDGGEMIVYNVSES